MVLPEARSRLHKGLDDLITGRITDLEFDEVYDELNCSPDRAVAEISTFGWGLYSDCVTYRITEHYRIHPKTGEIAERCLLFLGTDVEYKWPQSLRLTWKVVAGGLGYNLFPVGIALSLVSLPLLILAMGEPNDFIYFLACGVPGFSILACCYWLWDWSNRRDSPAWKKYWASGDQHAWPFLTRNEYLDHLPIHTPSATFIQGDHHDQKD
jgi:hypothetical protein